MYTFKFSAFSFYLTDSHSFSYFSLYPLFSLGFFRKMSSLLFTGFSFFLLFFFIFFKFLGVLLKVQFFVISRILNLSSVFFISFKFLGVIHEVAFFVTSRILILSPVFLYLLQVPRRFAKSSVLCRFSGSHLLSYFSLSPSCFYAFSWKLRSMSFSDSHSLSCFSLSPSISLAFCWKFSSLSFLEFSFALLFFFICFMFLGVFLEFAFFVLSRIPSRSPVFIYLPHVHWHSPGSWVLFYFSDSHFFSYFSL